MPAAMPPMKRLLILISGRGSNMSAIVDACRDERWDARVVAVIASRPDAAGLAWAASAGVPTDIVEAGRFTDRSAFEDALAAVIDVHTPDWIVLAGFMRVLGAGFVSRYAGRIVNIHPSLLPAFTGLHTHRRALEAGVKVHGATVHLVDAELDAGPIIAQAVVPVLEGDDEASLAARVLAAEHRLYPTVLRWLVEGRVVVHGRRVALLAPAGEGAATAPPWPEQVLVAGDDGR